MLIKRLALCAALSFVPRLALAAAGKGEQKLQIETENAVADVRGTSSWNP